MSEHLNRKLCTSKLPSFLNSRKGWGDFLEAKRSPFPHLHQIEPTNACPYHCIMCPRGNEMKREIGLLDFALFRKVIDEVATYPQEIKKKEIELFHFGESLLHPQIAEMNAFAVSKGLNTVLSVNAKELNGELAEKLIDGGATKLIVSLDGFDEESFRAIRGRSINYEEAIGNILQASSLIALKHSRARLIVRMIALSQNRHQIEPFTKFWSEKGIEAEIRPFFPWGDKTMTELGDYEKYPPYMPCPFPWQYLVVQWNGDVVACCRDFNAENKMGNVNEASLKEIWNSDKYITFRENMVSGHFNNTICEPCLKLYYTEPSGIER